ncbi:4-hydroxy-tetrahydrodipicolinate synthase [Oligella ureolytica]
MTSKNLNISGSLVALVTPMFSDGGIDWDSYRKLIDWHIQEKTAALVVMGSTGEVPTIPVKEHIKLIRVAVEHAAGRIPVIAGTGANSTTEAIELTRAAKELGVAACLSVVPYYNKPTQEGIYQHFKMIAEHCDVPIILYDVPSRTITQMSLETIVALSKIDNIVGLKDATGDMGRANELFDRLPESFSVYSGDDASAAALILLGARGNISVTANLAPALMHQLCDAALKGDVIEVRRLSRKLASINQLLFIESNLLPIKWAMHYLGLIPEGLRLPLVPLARQHHDVIRNAIDEIGLTFHVRNS